MPKRTYTVTYDGQTFTRTTARTYTHVVLVAASLVEDQGHAEEAARWDWRHNRAWHEHVATGQPYRHSNGLVSTFSADEVARSQAYLAGGLEGLIAAARARVEQSWRKAFGARDTGWRCLGWAGRADLALKQARRPTDVVVEVPQL